MSEKSRTVPCQQNVHSGRIRQAAIQQKGMQRQGSTMSQGWICSSKLWAWSSARGKPSMRKLLLPLFSMAFFNSPIVICSMALLVSCTTIYAQLLLRWQASVVLPDALCKQMLFRMLCTRRVEEDAAHV